MTAERAADLLAPSQLHRAAGLLHHLDMVVVDPAQRVGRMAVADLAGGERVDHAPARRPVIRHRFVAIGRHAAFAVGARVAVEADDAQLAAVDRAFLAVRALAPAPGQRIGVGERRRGEGGQERSG